MANGFLGFPDTSPFHAQGTLLSEPPLSLLDADLDCTALPLRLRATERDAASESLAALRAGTASRSQFDSTFASQSADLQRPKLFIGSALSADHPQPVAAVPINDSLPHHSLAGATLSVNDVDDMSFPPRLDVDRAPLS